jgi:hypothetical protein
MKIYEGEELETYKTETLGMQASWGKRDFVNYAKICLDSSVKKVLVITGLKGVGNTVGILQAAEGYDVTYMLAQKDDSETGRDYINFLKSTEKR